MEGVEMKEKWELLITNNHLGSYINSDNIFNLHLEVLQLFPALD